MLNLYEGRPSDTEGLLEKEIAVYDLLDKLGITYERVDHEAAFTMEACREIDEALSPATLCKNLLLCNSQKTKFYLLMIVGSKKFKTKEVSHQINSARLSFADGEFMERFLDITPGSLSIMGIMNDKDNNVNVLIDEDLLRDEYVGCHPCVNTSSIRLKTDDLINVFFPAVGHTYQTVVLSNDE